MVVFRVETVGKTAFNRGMNRYAELVKDWRPAFEEIYKSFTDIEDKNFKAQGYPRKFKQLSPRYAAWKAAHFPGRGILTLHGALHASLTGRKQVLSQHTVKIMQRLSAEFATTLPYASAHQNGVPSRGLPKRAPVQLTGQHTNDWASMLQKYAWRLFINTVPDGSR